MSKFVIPDWLVTTCKKVPKGSAWLDRLADVIIDLTQRWSLTLGTLIEEEASCSWVAHCTREDETHAVLKLGLPHMEADHEIDGLLFWNGDPSVFLLEKDVELNAMLLERCQPGTTLRMLPEEEQDEVIANLLQPKNLVATNCLKLSKIIIVSTRLHLRGLPFHSRDLRILASYLNLTDSRFQSQPSVTELFGNGEDDALYGT